MREEIGPAGLVRRMYAAYNERDAERLLAMVTDDVDWPDGPRRMHGKDALRDYWTRQWQRVHTHDEAGAIVALGGGRFQVHIEQTVRTPDGTPVSAGRFRHTLLLRDGLAARLDIEAG
ncbi:nuclear transport factor 2 family protein [Catenuloplanes japonicus]|uniref:nuclear transport factor 2 family protein n=1 Tax=Catenuloplanes japonicus TaxID=33876 RepID=UPI00068A537B|nr:nuclear transport factor 2 family protein [Catenuloplanes japonicus]